MLLLKIILVFFCIFFMVRGLLSLYLSKYGKNAKFRGRSVDDPEKVAMCKAVINQHGWVCVLLSIIFWISIFYAN